MSALEFLIAIVGNVIAAEIYQNLPGLALWMVRRAAGRLAPEQRASAGNAWIEDQARIAGNLAKVGHALGCWRKTLRDEFARSNVIETVVERIKIRLIIAVSYVPLLVATLLVVLLTVSSFYSIWEGVSGFVGAGPSARVLSFLIALGVSMCLTLFSFLIAETPLRRKSAKTVSLRLRVQRALDRAKIFIGFTIGLLISVTFSYMTLYRNIAGGLPSLDSRDRQPFLEAIVALEKGDKLAILAFAISLSADFLILAAAILLWSSHSLVIRTGVLTETLRKSLEPYADKIKAAFVYGSVARGASTARSDIDLMVIGEALNYSELYATLQDVENALGRKVSPVFLSPEDWRSKASSGDSFISKVNALPKIFVFGSEQDLQL